MLSRKEDNPKWLKSLPINPDPTTASPTFVRVGPADGTGEQKCVSRRGNILPHRDGQVARDVLCPNWDAQGLGGERPLCVQNSPPPQFERGGPGGGCDEDGSIRKRVQLPLSSARGHIDTVAQELARLESGVCVPARETASPVFGFPARQGRRKRSEKLPNPRIRERLCSSRARGR
jgi:hypothetical protein